LRDNPAMLATLETKIRNNAGLVAEALLVGPDSSDDSPSSNDDDMPSAPAPKSKKAAG